MKKANILLFSFVIVGLFSVFIVKFAGASITTKSENKIPNLREFYDDQRAWGDRFGCSIANIGDLDGDGVVDFAVGADMYDTLYGNIYSTGALWIVFMNSDGTVKAHQRISGADGFPVSYYDFFGSSVTNIGDLNGDGVTDLAVGAYFRNGEKGSIYILFMNTDGTVSDYQRITQNVGSFSGTLHYYDEFGRSITSLGDLDGDGVLDIAVGAPGDSAGIEWDWIDEGAVWILFLNSDGTVKSHQKISNTEGNLGVSLFTGDSFGSSIANLGDFNGDGVTDLAVGANGDWDGGDDKGAVYILYMNTNGTVKGHNKISEIEGNFGATLFENDRFGSSVANIGDMNNDDVIDLAVGARNDGRDYQGVLYILLMNSDGSVNKYSKISDTTGNFGGELDRNDHFGSAVTSLGDLNGDGVNDLAVGAPYHDYIDSSSGAVWILFLDKSSEPESFCCAVFTPGLGPVLGTALGVLTIVIAVLPSIIIVPLWVICSKYPELCPREPTLPPWKHKVSIGLIASLVMLYSSIWINFFPPTNRALLIFGGFMYGLGLSSAILALIQFKGILSRYRRRTRQ